MKNILQGFLFLAVLTTSSIVHAQIAPAMEWQKCLGGVSQDWPNSVQQTFDGGYIVAGFSYSNDGDVSGNDGTDMWIVKLDGDGNLAWQECFGGSNGYSIARSIQQTNDSGFIVSGITNTTNGDVSGNHGSVDFWVVKLDMGGNLVWQKCLGGNNADEGESIQPTSDGGYIVAGSSASIDGDVTGNHGWWDYWIVKIDSAGVIVWQKNLGGSFSDKAYSIQQTFSGGYIVAGTSESNDGDVSGNHITYDDYYEDSVSSIDYWVVKLDSNGNIIWQKSLGGSGIDEAFSVLQTTDGGFMVAGRTHSNDGDVTENHPWAYGVPSDDSWIVKLDSNGNLLWQKCLGGSYGEWAYSIQPTTDGGYIVGGVASSFDGDVSGVHGIGDYWIVKLDHEGSLLWQKCLGGDGDELAYSIQQTNDGGYIAAGSSTTQDDYDDVLGNHGAVDYWVVKLTPDIPAGLVPATTNLISLYPNPVESQLTINLNFTGTKPTIHVYDLGGRIIPLPITFTNTHAKLETEKLPDGFYTLQIINNKMGELEFGKFVKGR